MTMRGRRGPLAAATVAAGLLALTACGGGAPAPVAQARAAAAAPITAQAPKACRDGLSPVASLDPGSITTSPSSWPKDSAMAAIKKRGTLRVGTSGDAVLWGYSDPRNGDLKGFDVDVADAVAKALGVQVEYRVLPLSGRLAALKSGQVDLVAERMSMTCDRWQGSAKDPKTYINFSSQYYTAGQRVLVRSDLAANRIEDLKGQSVCAVAGSTSLANLQGLTNLDLKIVVAQDSGQCLVKFQEGEAVAISADDTTLAGFAAQDKYAKVVGEAFTSEPYGLGTSATAPEFTRFVNAVLEQLRSSGALRGLYAKWMAPNVSSSEPAVPQPLYRRDIAKLQRAAA